MKKILVVILITLLILLTFLVLEPGILHAGDDNRESRLRAVWVLYSDRNTDVRVDPGFVKEVRTIKLLDGQCAADSGCHNMSSQDKRYSKCMESCIVYTDWKRINLLTYEKKPFDQDLVIWNIKNR